MREDGEESEEEGAVPTKTESDEDGSSLRESDIKSADLAGSANRNVIAVTQLGGGGARDKSHSRANSVEAGSVEEKIESDSEAGDKEEDSFRVGAGLDSHGLTPKGHDNSLENDDKHSESESYRKVNTPGNQQDGGRAKSSENDQDEGVSEKVGSQQSIFLSAVGEKPSKGTSEAHRLKMQKYKEQKYPTAPTRALPIPGPNRSGTLRAMRQVTQLAVTIPKEYEPTNMQKLLKKPRKTMTETERKRVKDLEQSSMMLLNSNKLMSMA